jgi:hypothetical protein
MHYKFDFKITSIVYYPRHTSIGPINNIGDGGRKPEGGGDGI